MNREQEVVDFLNQNNWRQVGSLWGKCEVKSGITSIGASDLMNLLPIMEAYDNAWADKINEPTNVVSIHRNTKTKLEQLFN